MSGLGKVVNIGPVLAGELAGVGIDDLESLKALGTMEAARRLEAAGKHDCSHAVLAIEGAIQGIRWMQLPLETRRDVSQAWRDRV